MAHFEELEKARAEIRKAGADIAVISSYHNLTYAAGIEIPVPVGAGHEMTYAPWLAVIPSSGGAAGLVAPPGGFAGLVAGQEAAGTDAITNGYELFSFEGFDSNVATDPAGTYVAQVKAALAAAGATGGSGTIGIETRFLPFVAAEAIREVLPNWSIIDIEPALKAARWIKTAREIEKLRFSSHISDVGQKTLAELVQTAGDTESQMFAEISRRIFEAANGAIPLSGELVTGIRTTMVIYPNGPRFVATKPGDGALMDLSGRVDGYWFDCTNTHIIGGIEATDDQRRFAKASQAACEAAMAALRPGNKASDASAAATAAFASYGLANAHYTGHQIGVTVNEHPRLVPYDHSVIEAGMVFSVEPGCYQGPNGTFGARSEKMVLVREDGPEILSTFEWGIN
jgi:Xaa-Pro aminopeptidase